jgi:hypothetical protein
MTKEACATTDVSDYETFYEWEDVDGWGHDNVEHLFKHVRAHLPSDLASIVCAYFAYDAHQMWKHVESKNSIY